MNTPLSISVIVPTYNRANLISETLRSILQQSYQPEEIIVVDDGSHDETEDVVRQFRSIRYLRIQNSGECTARNIGVSSTSAPFVAFCDSDDLWHRDKLLLQARLFEDNSDLDYSFTNFRTVIDGKWSVATKFDSSPVGYWELPRRQTDSDGFIIEQPLFKNLLRHQPIFPSTLLMKRSFFELVGRWNEALGRTLSVDLEFHLRCVGRAPIGVVSAPVVGIRKHNSNFSGDPLKSLLGEIEILRFVLKHNPDAKSHEDLIRQQVTRRFMMAAEAAFANGDLALARELFQAIPSSSRSWKLHVKRLLCYPPLPIAQALCKAVRTTSSCYRTL